MGWVVRVAVIGSGVSGLCAARELQREGHRVVVFEKRDRIGGTRAYDPRVESDPLSIDPAREIIHGSLYRNLRTNLPRQLMSFSDYPFLKREGGDPRSFPGHEEVLRFLDRFVRDFGLAELVRVDTEVVRVARVGTRKDEWVVESRTGRSDSVSREVFEAVVVCSGNFVEPEIAAVEGIEKWPGYQIHSHNYRIPEQFRGQVVVIIGYGASAFDISRDISSEAKEVHLAIRKPGVKLGRVENHKNIWHHMMIERVYEDGTVAFQDGFSVCADTILHCTGFKYHYPFLETNGIVTVEENRVGPLYNHVFPPSLAPWLSFIGIPIKGLLFDTMELQSKWIARVLSGKLMLPSEEEMMASTEEFYKKMEENGLPKRSTHFLLFQIGYQNWLCAQLGLPPIEEWKYKMYEESLNNIYEMRDIRYKDQWDDAYWEGIIKDAKSI
ncbi:Flavin-containing monooxygenase FMO GS-OX-like 3 [Morus notabilis]|uniref:Flavin-containing monooxygenase n=1 Tax=Morus notabilis TaxID=981085 RepID=W9QSL0_9ROSA|nr:flavin-containing monooxygenase FMO GS-OX5 [Morus notabilis]EXB37532.1 Flavin-containing monooxygenase FMO GS-OX-like 3 [Morus notabilis]